MRWSDATPDEHPNCLVLALSRGAEPKKWRKIVGGKGWRSRAYELDLPYNNAVAVQGMAQNQEGTVDLLEIYHARQMRAEIVSQIRRLRRPDPANPLIDYVRRRETRSYYEAMLLATVELLKSLGDRPEQL